MIGHCSFRIYLKSKPGKYGIKIWTCSTADGVILSLQVYTGKINNAPEKGQAMRVVMDLVTPFMGEWREVTADNLFTSVELVEALLERQTLYTGTMRANKPQLPPEFIQTKGREPKTAFEGFHGQKTLCSFYERKGKKPVNILTTKQFPPTNIQGDDLKPKIVDYYNKTKCGVDVGDQRTRTTTVSRRSRVWPKKLFMEAVDIAAWNAFMMFTYKYPEWNKANHSRRSEFLRILAEQLAMEHMTNRLATGHLTEELSSGINIFLRDLQYPINQKLCNKCAEVAIDECWFCKELCCQNHRRLNSFIICKKCDREQVPIRQKSPTPQSSKRCARCSRRKVSKTNKQCASCICFVCQGCSLEKKINVCESCQ